MKLLKFLALGLFILILAILAFLWWIVDRQGIDMDATVKYDAAQIAWDKNGIPTINAPDWDKLIEAQGYIVAGERLWQMDLIRRKTAGRLSEWFGEAAFMHDLAMRSEDRLAIAEQAAASLPANERKYCDAYARGVSRFIEEHPQRWGLEYILLRSTPEPWTCGDSMLALLAMADQLTSGQDKEILTSQWRSYLNDRWMDFMFPMNHPWNRPLFDQTETTPLLPPPASERLPHKQLIEGEEEQTMFRDSSAKGSNAWAWRGKSGHFLANDPHLGHNVPAIWYAMRLRVSAEEWLVGVAIPGIPGIVIGRNPHFAWAFTNVGEDVDDLLLEKLNPDKTKYLAALENGTEKWLPLRKKQHSIIVRGEDEPRKIEAWYTHRGPVITGMVPTDAYYSRQWLPLIKGVLRLPVVAIGRATSWQEFKSAADGMRTPAQNALFMDNKGNMGYRTTGTGIKRSCSGIWSQPGTQGEWLGLEPPEERRHLFIARTSHANDPAFIASANERKWIDRYGHGWAPDDRKERIVRFLSARDDYTRHDMEQLQLDTQSRYRQLLLNWIADYATPGTHDDLIKRFRNWDGVGYNNGELFELADIADRKLTKLLISRVKKAFVPPDRQSLGYHWYNRRAWVLTAFTSKSGLAAFGLDPAETADYLLKTLASVKNESPREYRNRWQAQHPFVNQIPLAGRLFAIKENVQFGAYDVPRAESPRFGPSVRLVWDMKNPQESTWILPVGQSGHIGSQFYNHFQKPWFANTRFKIFDDGQVWNFGGQIETR